jgi:hypothetical protein
LSIPIRRDNSSRRLEHMRVVTLRIPSFKDSYFQAFDRVNLGFESLISQYHTGFHIRLRLCERYLRRLISVLVTDSHYATIRYFLLYDWNSTQRKLCDYRK